MELLKQTKQNENLTISYSGFEVDAKIVDKETGKEYPYRQIFFTVNEETIVTKKKIGRGRSSSTSEYTYTEKKTYTVNHSLNSENIQIEEKICGYFVLATNKSKKELSMKQALGCYKQEWKVESIFQRLKGPLQVIPIYLKDPRHIEAMMYLLVTCAQIFTLVDREAKNELAANNERLSGLFPNKITTKNPKMEQIIDKFANVSLIYVERGSERNYFVSELTPVQRRVLEITHTNSLMYNSNYVVQKLKNAEYTSDILSLIGIG